MHICMSFQIEGWYCCQIKLSVKLKEPEIDNATNTVIELYLL